MGRALIQRPDDPEDIGTNEHHRRSVAASLVRGVYVLERDRQKQREGTAKPWWEFFQFELFFQLIDNDSSIFCAIYEFKPQLASNDQNRIQGAPRYVIAFRGTMMNRRTYKQDLKSDLHIIRNGLGKTSRFEIGMQAVVDMVNAAGASNVWLAGHSLGSAMAMLAGKNMAKKGVFLQAFLFNPPFVSLPIERIKSEKLKRRIRTAKSVITAGVAYFINDDDDNHHQGQQGSDDPLVKLAEWFPSLFVNPKDDVCSEYIGNFDNRERMERHGAGAIGKLAAENSIRGLLLKNRESEPLHFLPSAALTVNLSPPLEETTPEFLGAHGLSEWWRPNLNLESKSYQFR